MSDCSSRQHLQQLLAGELAETLEQGVTAHLETCAPCQQMLEQLTALQATPRSDREREKRPSSLSARFRRGGSKQPLSNNELQRLRGLIPPGSSSPAPVGDAPTRETVQPTVPGYEILRELGRGGVAVVYEARQLRLNRQVALKLLQAGDLASPEQLVRFCAEAEIIACLHHPHIVQIYEVGTHNRQPYFALELMEGGNLADVQGGKPLAARVAAPLIETLARTIHHAHRQGVIHRDLKPSNILLIADCRLQTANCPEGARSEQSAICNLQSAIPKVADFGLAKHLEADSRLTKTGHVMGTPNYMAPEQVRGQIDRVGPATDVYALGAILYELLTGRPPFSAPTSLEVMNQVTELDPVAPSRLLPQTPRDLEVICLKCLEKTPERRYASAQDLADDLRRFQEGEPIQARRVTTPERAWRWARRRPAPAALLVLVLLVAFLGFPTVTLLWLRAQDQERAAVQARNEAQAERNRSRQQSAEILLGRGLEFAQHGEAAKGLHWMLEGLRLAPDDAVDFQRVARTNLAAWLPQTCSLRHQLDHPDEIEAVAISPDGQTLATGGVRQEIQRWDAATGRPRGEAVPTPGHVRSLAFSPDGKVLLAGGGAHHSDHGDLHCWARRWDTATGEPLGPSLTHDMRVWAVAYSPDGAAFLVGAGSTEGRRGQAQLWDAVTDQPLGPPLMLPLAVSAVAFSPDGHTFLTATGSLHTNVEGQVQLWERASGRPIGPVMRQPDGIRAACFSPDGKFLLTAGSGRAMQRWLAATGEPVGEPLWHPAGITALTITPDGATILSCTEDGGIHLWDAATDRLLDARAHQDGWLTALAVSADGQTLLSGSRGDRTAQLWDLGRHVSRPVARGADGRGQAPSHRPARAEAPSGLRFRCVAYSPDGKTVLTGSSNGLAQLWEAATGRPLGIPLRHPLSEVRCAVFSPDGRTVATSCHDRPTIACSVRVWDAVTGQPLTPWIAQRNHVAALAFSPDGQRLATGDYSTGVHLWDAATGERVGKPLRQRDIVLSLAFSPDGTTLAAGTAHDWNRDPQARLWDVAAGQPIGEPLRHTSYVGFVAFSPDGKTLVTGSLDNTFRLWDAATGEPRSDSRTATKAWRSAALSPAGDRLVTAGGDGTARLWSLADGSPVKGGTLPHPRDAAAVAVAFSPDGLTLVVGHEDGGAQLWDVTTCKPLGPPVVQCGKLLGVTFASDGRSFLTTAVDGATRAWPVPAPLAEPDLDRLALLLEVRTALRMDEGQVVTRLTPEERQQRFHRLTGQETTLAASIAPSLSDLDWHDARAHDAEQTEQPFTARWHLDRLIAATPNDWLLYARRARTHTDEERWDLAEADHQRAMQHGSPDDVAAWYRRQAWSCQSRQQWSAALWYLDRLLRVRPDEEGLQQRAEVQTRLGKAKE